MLRQALWQLVYFDERDSNVASLSRNNGGVIARRQRREDRRLRVVRRCKTSGSDFHLLRRTPVIICLGHMTIGVIQGENRIGECSYHRGARQARSDGAQEIPGVKPAARNESANQNIVVPTDPATRAQIQQPRSGGARKPLCRPRSPSRGWPDCQLARALWPLRKSNRPCIDP